MRTLSPSAIDVFIACPRKFYIQYDAKVSEVEDQEEDSLRWLDASERGTFIHAVLEDYVKTYILPVSMALLDDDTFKDDAKKQPIVDKLRAIAYDDSQYDKVWEKTKQSFIEEKERKNYKLKDIPVTAQEKELEQIKKICRETIKKIVTDMHQNHQYPVMAEQRFGEFKDEDGNVVNPAMEITMEGRESFAIRGIIDRVDLDVETGTFIVVDYKSGKASSKQILRNGAITDPKARYDLIQDWLYQVALEKIYPSYTVTGSKFIFTNQNNYEIRENMTAEGKKVFLDKIFTIVENMNSLEDVTCKANDNYPEGEHTCSYCGYKEYCDAYDELGD